MLGAAGAIAQQDFATVIADRGIANAPFWIGKKGSQDAGLEIELIEFCALGEGFSGRVMRVITEVSIPMTIGWIEGAGCENDIVIVSGIPIQKPDGI